MTANRDTRLDDFRETITGILLGNVTLVAWLATGERSWLATMGAWLIGYLAGAVAWILLVERRVPKPGSIRMAGWSWDVDRLPGVLGVLAIMIVNGLWQSWLPGLADAAIPPWNYPDSIEAIRTSLAIILATSIVVTAWIPLRLVFLRKARPTGRSVVGQAP